MIGQATSIDPVNSMTGTPTSTISAPALPTGTPLPVISFKLHPNGNAVECLDVKGDIRANGTLVQV